VGKTQSGKWKAECPETCSLGGSPKEDCRSAESKVGKIESPEIESNHFGAASGVLVGETPFVFLLCVRKFSRTVYPTATASAISNKSPHLKFRMAHAPRLR
jgi:hypothetical protein